MKARKVEGLDPDGTLADNAARIVRIRLDELHGFVPAVLDPGEVEALHDMRIAAKRLRYVLEVAGTALGPRSRAARKVARDLQEVLGDVHDCDELLPRVEHDAALADRLRERRSALYERFLEEWAELERRGWREQLEEELSSEAGAPGR